MAELEPALAAIPPDHLLYEEATRLRIAWRIASGERERGAEALRMVDPLIARGAGPADYVTRAEAALLAGEPDVAWATLARSRPKLAAKGVDAALRQRAVDVARALPERPGGAEITAYLEQL